MSPTTNRPRHRAPKKEQDKSHSKKKETGSSTPSKTPKKKSRKHDSADTVKKGRDHQAKEQNPRKVSSPRNQTVNRQTALLKNTKDAPVSDTSCTASLSSCSTLTDNTTTFAIPQHVRIQKQHPQHFTNQFKSRFVAMDCEMVGIGDNGTSSALARVTIVDWDGDILLDTYVRVTEPVTDLRTDVSGIQYSHIDGSSSDTKEFEEVSRKVREILSGKILVGHGLKNDLGVLNISHPWQDVRDTTKFEAYMKHDGGMRLPRKLKELAKEKIGVSIQKEGESHCSIEDAVAAMQLYRSVSKQWEKVMEYKIKKTQEILSLKQQEKEL